MPDPITPAEAAAYASLRRAVVSIRLNLGRRVQESGGITLVQFEILFLLEQSPNGLRMHEIADAVGVSRSGLTYQVGQMEQAGWVRRTHSESNSRAVVAALTDAGHERIAGLQELHLQFLRERAFGPLSEDELKTMTSIFQRIAASVSATPDTHVARQEGGAENE